MEWIITCKVEGKQSYKVFDAFNELKAVDWHMSKSTKNIQVGDFVYIYVGVPYSKIMIKTKCIQLNVSKDMLLDDRQFGGELFDSFLEDSNFMRLELIGKIINDEKLSLEKIKELELITGNIQGSIKSSNHEDLFQYIKSVFDLHFEELKKHHEKRILFCNVAYMKKYDYASYEEIPLNGGSYVRETKDAYEKNNFHICEDGYVRGFVETKYVGGPFSENKKPKQLHIEKIDSSFAKEESIDKVQVVFCAHSNEQNNTVIVGWYNNATVFRDRQIYAGRQYNLMAKATDCTLLPDAKRIKVIPRASQNDQNLGFGQANIWYANKEEHKDFVNNVFAYMNSVEKSEHAMLMKSQNKIEDDKLNGSLKTVKLDENYVFEYTNTIVPKPVPVMRKGVEYYKRDRQRAINALSHAKYMCELNACHQSFIRKKDGVRYTEAHHLIPMAQQCNFSSSLDIEENIVSLCSNCHNEIHYGENAKELITKLYDQRKNLLKAKNIDITLEELLSYYD